MSLSFGIRFKLLLSYLFIATLCISIIGIGSFYIAKNSLQAAEFDQLTSLREMKQQQIEEFFKQIRDQVDVFSQDYMIIDAMREFKKTFFTVEQDDQFTPDQLKELTATLKKFYREIFLPKLNANVDEKVKIESFFEDIKNPTVILQNLYIVDNPYPDKRINYDRAKDKSNYTKVHAKYQPVIREYLNKFGYYDLFLIDSETGYVVYNASKEIDFASNITKGPFRKTNITQGFFEVQEATNKDFVKFVDFQYYEPSQGMPSAFVMAPIYDGDKKIGVLTLQLSIEKINKIMTNNKKWKQTGLGDTGESYIIGNDYKMRSDSRFLIQDPSTYFKDLANVEVDKDVIEKMRLLNTTILIQEVRTDSGQEVMRGNSDTRLITDYRGVPNISSYTPLDIKDAQWGIIAEMDYEELLIKVRTVGWQLFVIGLSALFLVLLLSFALSHFILLPFYRILKNLKLVRRSNYLNLRERVKVNGKDIVAQLGSEMNSIFSFAQKGTAELIKSKKNWSSYLSKIEGNVHRLTMTTQALLSQKDKEGNYLEESRSITTHLREAMNAQSSHIRELSSSIENIQAAKISIIRSLESVQNSLEQNDTTNSSSLRILLDEGTAGERKIEKILTQLNASIEKLMEQTTKATTAIQDLDSRMGQLASKSSSIGNDIGKIGLTVNDLQSITKKIKELLDQLEQAAQKFSI